MKSYVAVFIYMTAHGLLRTSVELLSASACFVGLELSLLGSEGWFLRSSSAEVSAAVFCLFSAGGEAEDVLRLLLAPGTYLSIDLCFRGLLSRSSGLRLLRWIPLVGAASLGLL